MSDIELTTKQRNKITRACKALDDVRKELQAENPGAYINWYLEDSANMNLMNEESHDTDTGKAMPDRVIELFYIPHASGGGW